MDFAAWDDVGDGGLVLPGGVSANIVQFDEFELKVSRVFVGLGGSDDQARVVAGDCIDQDRDLFTMPSGFFGTRPSRFRGRNVDLETIDLQQTYVHWLNEQAGNAGVKGKVFDGNERGTNCRGWRVVPRVEAQAVAGNCESTKDGDVHVI